MAVRGKHGAMLAGRYRLLEQLGEGGMGSVWKAEHLLLHSHVAIKIIDPDVARLEFNLARFLREAKTLATLRSPNVVQVLDFGSDADTPYLVMELLEGQTLGRRLTEQGRLSLSEMSRVMNDVCTAMSLVHEQGLIHRDLKPENIFLCDNGEQRVTKVVDFGIAKSLRGDMSASMKTRTGHMLGTPSYMSPEQCRGLKDIDHRADLWALGVITYECLVGKVPFEGEVLGDLLLRICMDPLPIPSRHFVAGTKGSASGALPASFDAWFAKAVARDRTERHQSAAELASSLAELSRTVGLAATLHSRAYAVREGSMREGLEPSRPSQPRVSRVTPGAPPGVSSGAASGAASGNTRQPSNTETNTTVGLVGAALKVDRRARALALAAIALSAGFGLWALGNDAAPGRAESVDVHGLRPPFELTPKTIRSGVPSGRRWQTASDLARAAQERSVQERAAQQQERAAQERVAEATAKEKAAAAEALAAEVSGEGGVASAVSAGTVVANLAPLQPSSSAAAPSPGSGAAGSPTSGAASGDVPPGSGAPGLRAAGAAPPSASGQRGFAPGAPSAAPAAGASAAGASAGSGPSGAVDTPATGAPNPPEKPGSAPQPRPPVAPSATPPRALRGTAAPAPRRARAVQPSETSIRRNR